MLFQFGNVLTFLLVGAGFVFVVLLIGRFLRPEMPSPEKLATYECGEIPSEPAWIRFNIRFYLLALLFIIFDVEIAFIFPIAVVFKDWVENGLGWLALAEVGIFILILLLGLVYAWIEGDLEWVKKVISEKRPIGGEIVSKATKIS